MERFIRTEWLIGRDKLCKLQQAAVAVFGLGGVGAAAVEGLARTGIGTLILVDHDKVSLSNLNRQLI
ncbi:MAG TPA: ThiF family adenylyltransferase, partial [Limnochordia bacterium]|nr:ThiF family adenylyltransferase [Limnochordia bacterium]